MSLPALHDVNTTHNDVDLETADVTDAQARHKCHVPSRDCVSHQSSVCRVESSKCSQNAGPSEQELGSSSPSILKSAVCFHSRLRMHDANAVTTIELDVGFLDLSCKDIQEGQYYLCFANLNPQIWKAHRCIGQWSNHLWAL